MKPFVEVRWLDAADLKSKSWASEEEVQEFGREPTVCRSRGWLVAKSRMYVSLAGDFSPSVDEIPDDWGRVIKIPKKMIAEILVIEPAHDHPAARRPADPGAGPPPDGPVRSGTD